MATQIKNFNGNVLANIPDKSLDTTSSTLELPGTGYQNYGSHVLDNLVWIMQHFARDAAPDHAVKGQIWLDTTGNILKMYSGTGWIASGSIVAAGNAPANPVVGTFWWDTTNLVLSVWNALSWTVVAPVEKTAAWLSTKNNAPDSNNVRLLGNTTNRFNTVYTVNLDATGNISANQASVVNVTSTGTSNLQTVTANVVTVASSLLATNITASSNLLVQGNLIAADLTVSGTTLLNGTTVAATQLGVGKSPAGGFNLDVDGISRFGAATFNQYNGPVYQFLRNDSASANNRMYGRGVETNGSLTEFLANDANNSATYWLQVLRTANTVNNVTIYTDTQTAALSADAQGNVSIPNGHLVFQDGTSQDTAGTSLKAASGYQKLPSGIIIQWGTGQTTGGVTQTVTLPTAFTTSTYTVTISESNAQGGWLVAGVNPTLYGTSNRTTSQFDVYAVRWVGSGWAGGSLSYSWTAVGY